MNLNKTELLQIAQVKAIANLKIPIVKRRELISNLNPKYII